MYKNPTDNHHDSHPEKRRRPELSSLGPPPSKTSNKQTTGNTPTKKPPPVAATGSTLSAPPTATPVSSPATIPGIKGSSTSGKTATEPSTENPVNSNLRAGDSTSLKPPQAASILLPTYEKSTLPNGKDESISDSLPSTAKALSIGHDGNRIPYSDDQAMLPPKRVDKDSAESVTEDYEPRLDDILWNGVDIVENVNKRKGVDADLPKRKLAKLTAVVNLDCGTSDEATKVFVTIAKNGLNTRFEVTQEGSEY